MRTLSTTNPSDQENVNRRLWSRSELVRFYAKRDLYPVEAALFGRVASDLSGSRVLELGSGGGRVIGHLLDDAAAVTGLDIMPAMVEYCRASYPQATFVVGDIRSLPFEDGSFDVVVGMDNVIDAVGHEDRLTAIAEVHRVLAPGGLYLFSSHNRAHAPWAKGPRIPRGRTPARVIRCLRNRRRLRPLQRVEKEYSILNDCGHEYAVLHYYIDRDVQERQLRQSGFEPLFCMDGRGRVLVPGETVPESAHIHYAARRA